MIHFVGATQVKPTLVGPGKRWNSPHRRLNHADIQSEWKTTMYSIRALFATKSTTVDLLVCDHAHVAYEATRYVSSSGIHDKKAHCATQPNATAMSCTCTS